MPFPTQTFNTLDDWNNWVNLNIIPNGLELITGDDGNITENAAIKFIRQSPLNYQTAKIESGGGNISAVRPIVVFMTNTPTSLSWPDNIYNEYVFINTTSNNIPLASGFLYYDINLAAITNIPALSEINIVKASNSSWIQRKGVGTNASAIVPIDIAKRVGDSGGPIAGQTTYQNDAFINAIGLTDIIVNNTIESIENGDFTIDTTNGILDRVNTWIGPGGGYPGDTLIAHFYKNLASPIVLPNKNISVPFTNVTSYDLTWTGEYVLLRGIGGKFDVYFDNGDGTFTSAIVSPTTDSLTNPTYYHFDFGASVSGTIVF